jgi:hypothetical protein
LEPRLSSPAGEANGGQADNGGQVLCLKRMLVYLVKLKLPEERIHFFFEEADKKVTLRSLLPRWVSISLAGFHWTEERR